MDGDVKKIATSYEPISTPDDAEITALQKRMMSTFLPHDVFIGLSAWETPTTTLLAEFELLRKRCLAEGAPPDASTDSVGSKEELW
jgi:hypothetical protein